MYAGSDRLSDVEFLIRSTNRLDVLEAVADGPRDRHDLRMATDFSRVTLSRILGDLVERGWVTRIDTEYEITAEGEIVAREVRRLFGNLEALDMLEGTVRWLPTERFDFELSRLADAEVMLPDEHDLTAQIRWVEGRIEATDRVRSVGTWVAAEILDTLVESTVNGDCRCECVVESHVVDHIRDTPELRTSVRELLASDRASLYRYDGDDAEITMSILSDGVLLCGQQDARTFPEAVASTDEAVVDWATGRFESLRGQATRVDPSVFTA
jgi:predicted transcriptional regulator